jgi:hypothetical protein
MQGRPAELPKMGGPQRPFVVSSGRSRLEDIHGRIDVAGVVWLFNHQ